MSQGIQKAVLTTTQIKRDILNFYDQICLYAKSFFTI